MKRKKEIFDKEKWLEGLREQKISLKIRDAFHYVGDIVEDILEMLCDHEDRIEKLEKQLKEHKHLNEKAVIEL